MYWVHTYASVSNQSACWICTEIHLSPAAGLPWCIFLAFIANWTWLQKWNSAHSLWNATETDIYAGVEQQYDWTQLLVWLLHMGWLGLAHDEAIELAGPAPLCTENFKEQAQVVWTLIGLCQKHALKHYWEVQNNTWAAVPTGALWVCGSHWWPYLPGNWTGHCTWVWPYLPAWVQKTLMIWPVNWEVFKAWYQVKHSPL